MDCDFASFLCEVEILRFFHEVAIGNFAVRKFDFVMGEFVVVFIGFDADESEGQQKRASMEEFEPAILVHLAGSPSHNSSDAGSDEHERVGGAHRNVKPAMRPKSFGSADTQQNITREEGPEEHDFGSQKEPDADF